METASKVGPVGLRVAENLKRLRGRVPVRELSARLEALGRPILPSGITKIEQGSRRVDVDDLVALAQALEVSPMRLLLPAAGDLAELEELEERGALRLVVEEARRVVVQEGVAFEDLIDYLRLAERMRVVFEPIVAPLKRVKPRRK